MDVAQATSFALPACRPSTGQIANHLPRLINLVSARRQRSLPKRRWLVISKKVSAPADEFPPIGVTRAPRYPNPPMTRPQASSGCGTPRADSPCGRHWFVTAWEAVHLC